ncbi:MAG: ABC1 kinase family protein, partial [Planctomycetota bacterium]
PRETVEEFARTLRRELDFGRERRHLEQFIDNFAGDETVHFPRPFPERCSRRILTMERLEGHSVAEVKKLQTEGVDTKEVAHRGATLYLDMIFRDGFYHADPHPGNVWILPDGVIGLLDCGMVGRLDDQLQDELSALIMAAVRRDSNELTRSVLRLGTARDGVDRDDLRRDVNEYVAEYISGSMTDFDLSGALTGLTSLIHKHRIALPPDAALLIKVLVMLEGTSKNLDRDFSLAELIAPYQRTIIQRRLSPKRLLRRLRSSYRDWEQLLDMLPGEIVTALERMQRGRFDVNLNHRHLDTTINRLVYGILTAALFMGSAALWSRGAPPTLFGVSVFGAMGCVVAFVLGAYLLFRVYRSGGLDERRRR